MAGNTDKRIIQMQFENKQFEKNIAKSTKSVEDLKEAMNFEEVSKGLKKFADNTKNLTITGFEKLTDNIQKLTDKFTGLGTLSELVLSQIRRSIEQTAAKISNFVSSMTTAQVSAGMDKYEMLNKSVQTIKAATGRSEKDVYNVLERLNKYTDQTSYNFSDMAQNIGKFTSVGIKLEDAEKQMEGIANWAARSGAGIQEASRAMYNLSQAMGVGKMTLIDWKSIENAGMATKEFKEQLIQAGLAAGTLELDKKGVIKTAKSLGKQVEVSYQNVGQTFNKGWATSKVISSTLEKYYYDDLYYEKETEAILNLSEEQKKAFDKMIEADNKLNANEYKTLENMGVWTTEVKQKVLDLAVSQGKLTKETDKDGKVIYKTVNKTGKQIEFTIDNIQNSLQAGWFDKGFADSVISINDLAKASYEAAQKCLTFTDVLNAWKDQISTGWMTSFKIIFGELSESMEVFSNICDRVGDAIGELIDLRNGALQSWSSMGGRQTLIDIILGDYGKDSEEGAYGFLDLLGGVKDIIRRGLIDFLGLFGDDVDRMMMEKDPKYLNSFLGKQLNNITDGVENFLKKIRDFFNAETEFNGKTKTRLEVIGDVVTGIGGALKLGLDLLDKTFEFIGMIGSDLTPGLDSLLGFFGDLGTSIFNTADEVGQENKFHTFFVGLREDIKPLTDSLNLLMTSITNLLYTMFGLGEEGTTQTDKLKAVGDVIKTVASIITKIASPVITFLSRIIDLISGLFKNGVNAESLKEFGKGLGEGFSEMMNSFADALPEKFSFLSDWIHGIFGGGEKDLEGEAKSLFGTIFSVNKKADKTAKDAKKNEDTTGNGLLGLMTGSNVAVWVGVAALASIVLLINKARKVVGSVGKFFGSLGETLRDGIKIKFQDESFANKFIKIGAALALVAASIFALGSMPLNGLIQGGIAIIVVAGIMLELFKILQKTTEKGGYKNSLAMTAEIAAMAFAMMAFSVAIGMLALALVPFSLMSWEGYAEAMAGLGGVLAEIIIFMELFKALGLSTKALNFTGIAAFAIGIGLIVQGIAPFANMNWDQYARAMAGLGGVLLEIIGFMELFKILGLSTMALKFAGIASFAIAIGILVFAIKPFANMSWDQYARVMAGLGGVLLEILAFMELFKLLSLSTLALNFSGIVKFSLAIAILVFAIKPFASMSWDQYARVMAGLGGVLLEILAFMELFKLLGLSTLALNFSGIVKFSLAIAILVLAIQPFANMSWDQYARAMAGLGGVLLEILAFMELFKILGLSTMALNFAGILMFAFGIKILIDSLQPFTQMNPQQYQQALGGLMNVLIQLAAFMGILKLFDTNSLQIVALMGFAYGISALIKAIMPFTAVEFDDIYKAMVGLMGVLAIMLSFIILMNAVQPDVSSLLKLAVFSAILAAVAGSFAAVLQTVKGIDWKVIAAFGVGLTGLIMAMAIGGSVAQMIGIRGFAILAAGIVLVLGAIALMVPLLLRAVSGGMRDAAANLALMADMMGTFSDRMDGVSESSFDKLGTLVGKVGDIIDLIGKFIFQAGNLETFMTATAQLVLAADEMIKFDQRIAQLSTDGGTEKAMGIITAYEGMFTDHLSKFSEYLSYSDGFYDAMYKLGSGFDYFDSMTKNMGNADENQGLQLIKELASCASDLDVIYKMDLDKFKRQLGELGGAMILYAQGAKAVDGEEITDDTDVGGAITLLQKISESLSQTGGFAIPENMPTDEALTDFGIQLAALAGALVSFEEAGKGLGDGTDKALATLDFFSELKAKLQGMEGFSSDLNTAISSFKDKDGNFIQKDELTQFGEDIAQLGSSMAHFAASTQLINEETGEVKELDFENATKALESIAGLNEKLPRLGGAVGWVLGEKMTLNALATQIELLGTAMNEFHKSTSTTNKGIEKEIDFSNAQSFLGSIKSMITTLSKIKLGGIPDFFEGREMNFSDLAGQLTTFGSGLNLMSESISGTDKETGKPKFDKQAASDAMSVLEEAVVPLMTTLANRLPTIGGLGNLIANAISGRGFNLEDLAKQIAPLGDALGSLGQGLSSGGWSADLGIENAFSALDSLTDIMIRLSKVDDLYGSTAAVDFVKLTEFVNLLAYGITDQQDVNYGTPPIANALAAFMNSIGDAIKQFASTDKDLETLKSRLEVFKLFMESMGALVSTDMTGNWSEVGSKLTGELAASIIEGTGDVTTAITNMMKDARMTGENAEGVDWYALGRFIGLGVKNGVENASENDVTPAVKQMMIKAYEAGKQAIDAQSPSKKFAELGEYMGEGTAVGLKDSTKEVGENAGIMGQVALEKAKTMIDLISSVMQENMDLQPTITPMLDLTNLESGKQALTDGLQTNGITLGISGLSSLTGLNIAGNKSATATEPTPPDYSGIYERMNQLGEQISEMQGTIKRIKVVMDTGALVGALSDGIDNDFGRKQFFAGRNN